MGIRERIRRAAALFFPPRCPFCGRVVGSGRLVCDACAPMLPRVTGTVCPRCGLGLAWCRCGGNRREYARCVAPFYYEGAARGGILRMKYGGHPAAAGSFAVLARPVVEREYGGVAFDCVTSVPMAAAEQRARGFNQAALFGRRLARELSLPYREMLRKPRPVRPQHLCSAKERQENVRGTYTVLPGRKARNVLLADDVATTGATLGECAKSLRLAGADRVYCVTIACVRRRGNPHPDPPREKTEIS